MFLGLRSLIFRVNPKDLTKAKKWYAKLLGKEPYFDEPFYVGFNIGGFELGLEPFEEEIELGNNVQTYLGVPDIKKAFQHCVKTKATVESEVRSVGGEIKVANVRDPFGNLLGLIENPGFRAE